MANTVINTTGTAAAYAKFPSKYYDRQLLESAKTRFVHAEYGQKRPIPRNNGSHVNFRRWNLFDPGEAMEGLTEGETPAGQTLSQSDVEVAVKQYGAYVEVTDLLDLTAYDNVINDSAELLGEQIGTVIEWVTRDAMCATANVQYAGGRQARSGLTSSDKLTVEEIRKAVRTLKKNKARPFTEDGRTPHFICICSPEATYDLQSDENWKSVSAYSNAEAVYSGEIGRLYGVVFVESTESKVYEQTVLNKVNAATSSSATFVLKNDPNYIQGIPDLTVLYKDRWAALECKKSSTEHHQPNQDYYIQTMGAMSYAAFVYPENREEVLHELQQAFLS